MWKLPPGTFTISGQRSQSRNAFAEFVEGGAGTAGGFTTATFSSGGAGGFAGSAGGGGAAATGGGAGAAGTGGAAATGGGEGGVALAGGGVGGAVFFVCAGGASGFAAAGAGGGGAGGGAGLAAATGGACADGAGDGGAGGTVSTMVTARSPTHRRASDNFARSTKKPLGYLFRYARIPSHSLLARAEFQNAISSVRSSTPGGARAGTAGAAFAAGAAATTAGVKKNWRDMSLICWGRCVPRVASFTSDATSLSMTESSTPGSIMRLSSEPVNGLLRPPPSFASCPGAAAKATSVSRPDGSIFARPRPTAPLRLMVSRLRFRFSVSGLLRQASTMTMFSGTFDSIRRTTASSAIVSDEIRNSLFSWAFTETR
jgi:hypothetical protein